MWCGYNILRYITYFCIFAGCALESHCQEQCAAVAVGKGADARMFGGRCRDRPERCWRYSAWAELPELLVDAYFLAHPFRGARREGAKGVAVSAIPVLKNQRL
jgi:hypothetical protein